jgi:hypothetical protein
MPTENGSYSGVIAIFAIMLLTMLGGFIAWQAGVFGDGVGNHATVPAHRK